MRKILSPSVLGVFWEPASARHCLYGLLLLLGAIFIAAEIGYCGDELQNFSSGSSIVVKDTNPSGVSLSIKDKTQSKDPIPATKPQTVIPRVILNVNPSQPNSFSSSAIQRNNTVADPISQPLGSSRSALLRESLQQKVQMPAEASNSSAKRIVVDVPPVRFPQPALKAEVPPAFNSSPEPAPQIVAQRTDRPSLAQQVVSPVIAPVIAKPVSLNVNPQVEPAPPPQMPMNPPIYQVRAADSETNKDNGPAVNQPLVLAQQSQQLPQPPSIEGFAPQSDTAIPAMPSNPSDQKLGEAPPDTSLEFLRQQTVLLKPCEWQMDVGMSYLLFDHHFTDIIDPGILVDARLRQRLLTMPLEVRYGLTDRIQLFANIPIGWANTEISYAGEDSFSNLGGIGDTNAGGTILLRKSEGPSYSPDVLLTLSFTAPTGNGNALLSLVTTPQTTLGQGFWAGAWNLLVVHKYDPVVVFYGFGSRHYVEGNIDNFFGCKPGDQYMYQLGTGFALNERITLSTIFFGNYVTESRLNDQPIEGTILEPMYLRFATTITRPNKRIIEPFAEIGMTEDAANARVGITWTF